MLCSWVTPRTRACTQAYGKFKRMLKRYSFQRSERKEGDEEEELRFARKEGVDMLDACLACSVSTEINDAVRCCTVV